ncbi:hypothetical protein [Zoogloea sp. 1C4]|uniref:hypothetical protein n=1 Tax=Zoogloea sp. 1C4 TaxID=2570190 RepID=UPI001292035E|nr:hypothetical protein [Zoogloea sp. 1C4]
MSHSIAVAQALAARRAAVFNQRYPVGSRVMFVPVVGAQPVLKITSSKAFPVAGAVRVHVVGCHAAVDADMCFTPAPAARERCPERALSAWQLAAAFVVGFTAAVLLGLMLPPARAVSPEMISIDCDAPPAGEVELVDEDGRAQA